MRDFTPHKQEKDVISIRLDRELIKAVDNASSNVGISRNEFINQCIEFAMEHLSTLEK